MKLFNSEIRERVVFAVYVATFLLALHASILAYINSSFLVNFVKEDAVGLIFSISSLFTALIFARIQRVLSRLGNYRLFFILLMIDLIALSGLVFLKSFPFVVVFFIAHSVVSVVSFLNIDIFLENFSVDSRTGRIRGFFLFILNLAWVAGPFITGTVLSNGDYWKVFALSAILLVPVLLINVGNFRQFKDPFYHDFSPIQTFRSVLKDKDLYRILMVNFLLNFFYAWMVIYTPIYLHDHVGLSWGVIGVIFSVMLLPFVLLQWPLGRLADLMYGEKEILSIGFIVMAITTIIIPFVRSYSPLVWAAILFGTRIGASMVEVMAEVYFFKKINVRGVSFISFFRMMRPVAYLIAPVIASAMFIIFDLPITAIFFALGLVMFSGLHYSLAIKDTL
jgi:MFS family permease